MGSPALMTPQEFAGKVRAKYPGAYDNIPDSDLVTKVVSKYPAYGGQVDLAKPFTGKPNLDLQPEKTPLDYAKEAGRVALNAFTGTPGQVSTAEMSGAPRTGDVAAKGAAEIATPGHRLRGVLDLTRATSDIATPFIGPAAIENPVGVAKVLGTGAVGQSVGQHGAELFGANPDQSEAAGDIGALAGGIAGAKAPMGRLAEAAWEGTKAGAAKVPIVGPPVAAGAKAALRSFSESAPTFPGAPRPFNPGFDFLNKNAGIQPGAPFPENPGAAFLKENAGVYPGAHLPAAPSPEFPGAKLPLNPGRSFLQENAINALTEGRSSFQPRETPFSPQTSKSVLFPDEATAQAYDRTQGIAKTRASEFGMRSAGRMFGGKGPITMKAPSFAPPATPINEEPFNTFREKLKESAKPNTYDYGDAQ